MSFREKGSIPCSSINHDKSIIQLLAVRDLKTQIISYLMQSINPNHVCAITTYQIRSCCANVLICNYPCSLTRHVASQCLATVTGYGNFACDLVLLMLLGCTLRNYGPLICIVHYHSSITVVPWYCNRWTRKSESVIECALHFKNCACKIET